MARGNSGNSGNSSSKRKFGKPDRQKTSRTPDRAERKPREREQPVRDDRLRSQTQGERHRPAPRAPRLSVKGESLFGLHAVREAWLNNDREIHALYVTEQALRTFEETIEEARAAGIERPEATIVDKDVLDRQLQGAVHQGLLLDAAPLPELSIQDLVAATAGKERVVFAMLDQVTDPHNVGAILRSASAFGIDGLILQRRNAPDLAGVLAKTACGATEHMRVAYETNLSRTLEVCKEAGFIVIGMDEHAEKSIGEIEAPARSVIVLGAEGPGMRRLIRENCDLIATLPTRGAIRSLNVSNAAAIAFFALTS